MRILMVTSRFPFPPWRGNQLRTVQWLNALAGHQILLICPSPDGAELPADFEAEVRYLPNGGLATACGFVAAMASGRPAQEGIYSTGARRRKVAETVAEWRPDAAVVQMVRCGWAADEIGELQPELPLIFDAIDSMALHYDRAVPSTAAALRPAFRFEAARCRRREGQLGARATVVTAVSRRDLEALNPGRKGMVVPVAAGVAAAADRPPVEQPTVLLSGNLGYRPTVRAACWFAAEVWPGLRKRIPSVRWVLAGARPAPAIQRLGLQDGIEVHGDVTDLGDHLRQTSVAIAPMASGSGVAIKILEALAAEVPVVADPWSAAGLEDPTAVAVVDGAAAWVDSIADLLSDEVTARAQAVRGVESWSRHYEPARVATRIREAVDAAVEDGG
jgi:glycosyltransferase involved in cell wall biosynthesis